jgi:mannose-6-phosphate isomerase-like protein (cupin superfamily)
MPFANDYIHHMKIAVTSALEKLNQSGNLFTELYNHGSMSLEVYKPIERDLQQPHDRDEIYIVISGSGDFFCNGQTYSFVTGDFLFVPAHAEHRFMNFSADFSTWVIFYGPIGGEG